MTGGILFLVASNWSLLFANIISQNLDSKLKLIAVNFINEDSAFL